MSNNLSNSISELSETAKEYVQVKIDLLKLSVLSKATRMTTAVINSLVLILFGAIILLFSLAALVIWYGQRYDDYLTGLLLAIGILIVLAVLFLLLKKHVVTSTVMQNYSSILFDEEKEDDL